MHLARGWLGFCEEKVRLIAYRHPVSKAVKSKRKVGKFLLIFTFLIVVIAPVILTKVFGYGISPILTGSMRPYGNPGDLFLTSAVRVNSVRVGDVVVLREQVTGVLYSHRVVKISSENNILSITTKGDANSVADADRYKAGPKAQVSRVIARVRWIGRPLVYAGSIQGRSIGVILMVFANLLGLFVFLFRKPIEQFQQNRRENNIYKVYKELYIEERRNTEQYREIIKQFSKSESFDFEDGIGIPQDLEHSK